MNKKKIMLIDPPGFDGIRIGRVLGSFGTNKADQVWPPYDLQIMAGYCKKNKHGFKIIDANNLLLDYEELKEQIKKYQPDWVIFMTTFSTFLLDYKTASVAKEVSPKIKTACISLSIKSVENPEEQMEKLKDLDYIPWGEPEFPLMQLINGESPERVDDLYYRDKKNNIKIRKTIKKYFNLDEFGVPVHSCMDYTIYKCPLAVRLPMAVVSCSRGCFNQCVHCQAGSFQKPVRYRSLEKVCEELDEIKMLGVKEIKFWDCTLPNPEFVKSLCKRMIEKKYNFTWHCNTRAEFMSNDLVDLMKKAGCHTICIGCESSDNKILKNMNKNETKETIERAVRIVKNSGMRVLMYVTFGLEGETKKTMQETFRFVSKLMPEFVTFGIVVPAPGTPFYQSLKQKKFLINKKLEFRDPNALPAFSYPQLSPEEILRFSRSAYQRYYFNPRYILMRLSQLRSPTELKLTMGNGISVIKRYVFEKIK